MLATCCLGSAACCAGSFCCGLLCKSCAACGARRQAFARIGYVFFSLCWVIVALVLFFASTYLADTFPSLFECSESSSTATSVDSIDSENVACVAISAIVRMSFVLACFHLIVLLVILPRNKLVAIFHDGCWVFKSLLVLSLYVASIFIPNTFFLGYTEFARWVSIVYLAFQGLLVLLVAYKMNEVLVANANKEAEAVALTSEAGSLGCSAIILIVLTITFTIIDVVWFVFQCFWFECSEDIPFMVVTAVACVFSYLSVLLRTRDDASIFTGSVVSLYFIYLQWAALASSPNDQCNPFLDSSANTVLQIIVGLFVTFYTLVVVSGTSIIGGEEEPALEEVEFSDSGSMNEEPLVPKEEGQEEQEVKTSHHVFPVTPQAIQFQILMLLASIYFAMLLSNWGNPTLYTDSTDFFEANTLSFWIKIVAQWISILVYAFSILGPLCTQREFS